METQEFTEKLRFYLKSQNIKQKELADMVGVSAVTINNLLNGRDNFGAKAAAKWSEALGLNPLWLLTQGEQGEMLLNSPSPAPPPPTAHDDIINIPIISPDARGGFLPNDEVDIEQYTIGTMPFNRQIAHAGDIVIPVYGDSMTPKYPAGSYILIRPIEQWREYVELGRTYVLELLDWRRIIKILRKGHDATHYTLDSYNVDYESNEIAKEFINHVWLVVASVTREEL